MSARTRLLPLPEVADRIGVRVQRVRHLIRVGALDHVDIGTPGARRPTYRVSEAQLDRFIATRRATA